MNPTATLVPAGQDATNVQAGDLLFLHMHGPIRLMIHVGQWLRPSLRAWSRLTHVAVITDPSGALIEARWPRVRRGQFTQYRQRDYVHVRTKLHIADQKQAVAYLETCLGDPYGIGTFVGTATRMLTPGKCCILLASRWPICSGLAATALERGWFVAKGAAASLSPAELAQALGATKP